MDDSEGKGLELKDRERLEDDSIPGEGRESSDSCTEVDSACCMIGALVLSSF